MSREISPIRIGGAVIQAADALETGGGAEVGVAEIEDPAAVPIEGVHRDPVSGALIEPELGPIGTLDAPAIKVHAARLGVFIRKLEVLITGLRAERFFLRQSVAQVAVAKHEGDGVIREA